MKKFFTLLAMAVMMMAMPAKAQVKVGIKGGYNITNFSLSSDVLSSSNRYGFFIGPSVKVSLPVLPVGVEVAAFYDQRDAKLSDGSINRTVSQRNINIPVNIRYEIGLADAAGIYLLAGPQFGFNIGDKNLDWEGSSNNTSYKFKDSNLSVNLGAGVKLMSHVEIGFNYNIAVGKTGDATWKGTTDAIWKKSRSNAWQISLGYYF